MTDEPRPAQAPDCPVDKRDCSGLHTYRCDEELWGSPCRHWQARNGGYLAPASLEEEPPSHAELLARRFHETYERLAPLHGYQTREESATGWRRVPVRNRRLMIAVAAELLSSGHYVAVSEEIRAQLLAEGTRGLSLSPTYPPLDG